MNNETLRQQAHRRVKERLGFDAQGFLTSRRWTDAELDELKRLLVDRAVDDDSLAWLTADAIGSLQFDKIDLARGKIA